MSDLVRPQRWQPTRLRHPWDSPGKNTGVGCHFLLQYMKVKSESKWSRSVSVRLFMTPWTTAYQAPPAMGFSRQEYWSVVPLPSPILWLEGGKYFMLRGKDKIWQRHGQWVVKTFCRFQLLSCVLLFATPWTAARQVFLSSTVCWSLLKFMSIESWWYLSHPPPSPSLFALNVFQHQGLFQWVSSSHQVAKVMELQLQHQPFQWIFRTDFLSDWLVRSPWSPRESQESSPIPQFKSINSSVLSLLHSPTLTSIHDHRKNRSLD